MRSSIVHKKELNEEFRVDAEYYGPENLTREETVTKHDFDLLGNICELVAGPFGSTVTTEKYDPSSGVLSVY